MTHGMFWLLLVTIADHQAGIGLVGGVSVALGAALASVSDVPASLKRLAPYAIVFGLMLLCMVLFAPEANRLDQLFQKAK